MSRTRAATEMLLLFLAFFLPGYLAQSLGGTPGTATTLVMLQSILTGLPQLLLIAYVVGITGPFVSPLWGCAPLALRDIPRIGLLVAACFLIIAPIAALTLLLPPSWTSALTAGYRWELQSLASVPLALIFCLVAGYREELFFRAYLMGRLQDLGTPLPVAVAGSTLLFCMGHIYEGPLGIALSAGLGVLFSVAYARRRNLHVIALAHGLYNFAVLVVSIVAPHGLPGAAIVRIFSP